MANMKNVSLIASEIRKASTAIRADMLAEVERLRAEVDKAFDVVGDELLALRDAVDQMRARNAASGEEAPHGAAQARQGAVEDEASGAAEEPAEITEAQAPERAQG
jgi:hypothetical protein